MCNTTGETSGGGGGTVMLLCVGAAAIVGSVGAAVVNKLGDITAEAAGAAPDPGGGIPWALVFFVGGSMVLLGGIACWALIRMRRRAVAPVAVRVSRRAPAPVPMARRQAALPAGPTLTPPRGWPALPAARPALTAGRPARPDVVLGRDMPARAR